jgi:pimeloyl-ACP methyl ester carboxylesterase
MRTYCVLFSLILLNVAWAEEPVVDKTQTTGQGVVFYVCGAGGGSIFSSWAPGVRKGIQDSGRPIEFHEFVWQTGLGVIADQTSSVEYKRAKGAKLAETIVAYKKENPDRTVSLIGLSAGTAVVLYTLEALPENCEVDHVVLLGSSVDAGYDICPALTRVRDNLIVFTSAKDEILTVFVPLTGSADRKYVGTDLVGICGFHQPVGMDETRQNLYKKIRTIAWQPVFSEVGDNGGHTDKTNPQFVKRYLVPIITAGDSAMASTEKTGDSTQEMAMAD